MDGQLINVSGLDIEQVVGKEHHSLVVVGLFEIEVEYPDEREEAQQIHVLIVVGNEFMVWTGSGFDPHYMHVCQHQLADQSLVLDEVLLILEEVLQVNVLNKQLVVLKGLFQFEGLLYVDKQLGH